MRTSECVVIGGGVMGCAVAWRLAQAGVKTTVLERSIPGAEASSAAAGILAAQEESEGPGPLTELAVLSRSRFGALAAELREATGVDVQYRETGLLRAAADETDVQTLEARYGWQRARGWRLEWLHGDDVRAAEPALSPAIRSALFFPDDGQLEPRALARALSLAAARAGARFVTGAYVRRILVEGGRVEGVEVEGEALRAECVVVAAGSWSSLVEGVDLPARAVRPLRGQIAQIETRPPAVRGTIVSPRGGYVVGRADGRVLCGSTMEQAGYEKVVTARGLRHVLDVAVELVPALADAPVTDLWANFRPATSDRLPILGLAPQVEGLIYATGHFRNGILLCPITAEIVRDLVVSGRTALADLSPFTAARLH